MTQSRFFGSRPAITLLAAAVLEMSIGRGVRSKFLTAVLDGLAEATARLGSLMAPHVGVEKTTKSSVCDSLGVPGTRVEKSPPALNPAVAPRDARVRRDRKLTFLQRSGLFGSQTRGARISRAATLMDLRKAYKLVHEVYLGTGYIRPEPAGIRLRIFETLSETATFVAKVDGSVVGVLSIVGDTPEAGLPSDTAFKRELDTLRSRGLRLCEATNQAVADEYRKSAVPTELMRCAVAHMTEAGYDASIATVSPSHDGFYELLGFQPIGSPRSYSDKLHDPVVALSMDINQYRRPLAEATEAKRFIHQFLAEENHFIAYVGEWERQAKRLFLDTSLLRQLFLAERNFIGECTPEELQVLHERWGNELFAAVTGSLFIPMREAA